MAKQATRRATWSGTADRYLSGPDFGGTLLRLSKKDPTATRSLLHLDLDGLHDINQSAGHETGDRVLGAAIAVLAKTAAAERWPFGRLGGDEFALLASGVPLETAFLKAEELRREIDAAIKKVLPAGKRCTASIGVANAPRDAKTADALMRKADLALHAAKEQGGDAVGLVPSDEMALRSSYYTVAQLGRLKGLAERQKKKEAVLLREALDDLLRKYDRA